MQEFKDYGDAPSILESLQLSKGVSVSSPTVLLTDHNGQTNLNLQRDRLTKTDSRLSEALREGITRDLVAQALAFAPEQTPFSMSKLKKQKRRLLSAHFSLAGGEERSSRTTELSTPWCWEDDGWRLAEPTLALKKGRLLAIYGDYDLSFLESNSRLLLDTSMVWVKARASSNTADGSLAALRHFTRAGSFLGRAGSTTFEGYTFPVSFELVVSNSVFDKLRQSKLPNYLSPIMSSARELEGNYVCLSNLVEDDDVTAMMEKGLASQPSNSFAYAVVGGSNQHSLGDQDLFSNLWLELVGEEVVPVSFADREKSFPKAFEQLGERITFYRNQLN